MPNHREEVRVPADVRGSEATRETGRLMLFVKHLNRREGIDIEDIFDRLRGRAACSPASAIVATTRTYCNRPRNRRIPTPRGCTIWTVLAMKGPVNIVGPKITEE